MSSPSKKGAAWSEDEKRLLMLHIIGQLLKGGKVEVTQIDLPNRTPKAITHAWAGLKTEIKKLQDGVVPKQAASDDASINASKAGAKKRKRAPTVKNQEAVSESNDADEEDTISETF